LQECTLPDKGESQASHSLVTKEPFWYLALQYSATEEKRETMQALNTTPHVIKEPFWYLALQDSSTEKIRETMQALNTTPPRDEGAVLVLGIARLFYRKDKRNNAGTKHPPPRV
jgi:hypothetical protein